MVSNNADQLMTEVMMAEKHLADTDVCLSLDGGNLDYSSTSDIAGFQFSHNGCVSGASGGDATANGFTVSASGTTVLAFSFTGSVVPAGEGTLVEFLEIYQKNVFLHIYSLILVALLYQ